MKLIQPSYEIKEQGYTLEAVYKHIEWVARHCYKSEDRITDTSAYPFVERLINAGHLAMLEHGTVYLAIPYDVHEERCRKNDYRYHKYSERSLHFVNKKSYWYVTTNLRVIIENGWEDDLQYICEPTKHHVRRYSVKFVCDQGVMREFTRHRVFSFAVESTRFVNYSKDKFGNEITFIRPCWFATASKHTKWLFHLACYVSEKVYLRLLRKGWTPEKARNVLPLATKCEMVMTGFEHDWHGFFKLRAHGTTGKPHPQAEELAKPLFYEFVDKKL